MVLEQLKALLAERYACDEDNVTMDASLDALNLTADEQMEIVLWLSDMFLTELPQEALPTFETVEDLVVYIEDRMG